MEEEGEAAPAAPFSGDDLPDAALFATLSYLDAKDLVSAAATATRVHEVATDTRLWRSLTSSAFPADVAYVEAHPAFRAVPWRGRLKTWSSVQARWERRVPPDGGAIKKYAPRLGVGSMFCVNHIGGGAFLTGGAEGVVRVVSVDRGAGAGEGSDEAGAPAAGPRLVVKSDSGTQDGEGMLGMSVDCDAMAAGLASGVPASRVTAMTGHFNGSVYAWDVNYAEQQMLNSLPARRLKAILTERRIPYEGLREKSEFAARIRQYNALPLLRKIVRLVGHEGTVVSTAHFGDLAVSGSNDGTARVWSLGRKQPSDAGKCLAMLRTPVEGAGVDAVGLDPRWGVALTGDKAGHVGVWDLSAGAKRVAYMDASTSRGMHASWVWCVRSCSTWAHSAGHEPGQPRYGDDSTEWTEAVKGFGGGEVAHPMWLYAAVEAAGEEDEGTDAREREASGAAGKSGEGSRGSGVGAAQASDVNIEAGTCPGGDGRHLLSAGTDGSVSLWDLRGVGITAKRARPALTFRLPAAAANGPDGMANAVAGLAPMFAHSRFVTSSFDGCVRIFDLRRLAPVHTLRHAGGSSRGGAARMQGGAENRLSRCDVTPDLVVAGAMDGTVVAWDFWAEGRSVGSA